MSDVYEVKKVKDGFFIIKEGNVRMFLFEGSDRAMLIDTGNGTGDLASLVKSLTHKPVEVVITHADSDHTSANAQFGEVYMDMSDFALYRQSKNDGVKLRPLCEGDVIDLGGASFEVVSIPGHTPGSIALLNRGERFLISGDAVGEGPIYMFGDARSMEAYVVSIQKLIDLKDAYDIIYCSHNKETVTADILPLLIEGANEVARGNIEGVETDIGWAKPNRYDYREVSFYY